MRSAILILSAVTSAMAQATSTLFVNTPVSLITCQPYQVTFGGGTPPYYLSVIPGGQPGGTIIETLADATTATTYTWNVNLAPSTNVSLRISDNFGGVNYSGAVVVQAGASTACVGQAVSPASGGTTGTTTTSEAAPGTTTTSAAAAGSSTTTAAAASSTTADTSSSSAAASSSTTTTTAAATTTTTTAAAATGTTAAASTPSAASGAGAFSYSSTLMALVGAAAIAIAA